MKKRILSILLCLCVMMTFMPTIALADSSSSSSGTIADTISFGYAYDAQRDPSYPEQGATVNMTYLSYPLMADTYTSGDRYESNAGTWTLTKAGAYSTIESPNSNLTNIVTTLAGKYSIAASGTIIVHELKNGSDHVAYGVLVAYDETNGKALFLGDNWNAGGAGYLLSTTAISESSATITASAILTAFIPTYEIYSDKSGTQTLTAATVGYAAPSPFSVKVSNTGTTATGDLTVALSGTNADSFELSAATIGSIASGADATFTVTPKTGLAAGTYTATVSISNTNVTAKTFDVSFTVNPSCAITLSQTGTYEFAEAEEAYAAQTPLDVTVTNSGTIETGALTVALSGTNADSFELSADSLASIAVGGSATFTVAPKAGLTAGDYAAKITVSNTGVTAQTFNVEFTVNQAHSGSAYTPKKSELSVEILGGTDVKTEVLADGTKTKSDAQGTISVNKAGDTATITANSGYQIEAVKLNGIDKGKVDTLTGLKSTDKLVVEFKAVKKADSSQSKLAQAKTLVDKITLTARSTKAAKKNIKVTLKTDKTSAAAISELKDLGYTVKYKFYRSTKKASKYVAKATKTAKTYTNTAGKEGTKYYYKARVQVYDKNGKLVAQTSLKQCKYACRQWTK